ncbi:MAG: sigma-70 family RNA polymerase sigma factor [Oscillospiraceae bacterium]|jgi:RNA polymerase sigma-70 factor (ECF subfamily)|nr:sigma-70 family RNA polymerase sigma factor [Oscillospiraceae bacterium]
MEKKIEFYEELVGSMYDTLLGYARFRAPGATPDIVQDVCLIAWKRLDEVMSSQNPRGWMMNTLKNRILKYYEVSDDEHLLAELRDDIPDTSPQFDAAEGDAAFLSALNTQEKRIVSLKEQGYRHREIAEILGVQPGTVDSAVSRAKTKITAFLKTDGK